MSIQHTAPTSVMEASFAAVFFCRAAGTLPAAQLPELSPAAQHGKESRTGTSTIYNRRALLLPGAVRCSERLPSRRRVGSPAMADAPPATLSRRLPLFKDSIAVCARLLILKAKENPVAHTSYENCQGPVWGHGDRICVDCRIDRGRGDHRLYSGWHKSQQYFHHHRQQAVRSRKGPPFSGRRSIALAAAANADYPPLRVTPSNDVPGSRSFLNVALSIE
jgi:hypothetical protein